MRRPGRWLPLFALLGLLSTEAQAQFANRSLGLSVGYMNLDKVAGVIDRGIPFGLGASMYIDGGFEWTATASGMLLTIDGLGQQVVGATVQTGPRYLFLQETLRPYAGVDISYLHIFFGEVAPNVEWRFVGLGPNAGVDYFVMDTVSVGAKAYLNLYWMLNQPVRTSQGLSVTASAWF